MKRLVVAAAAVLALYACNDKEQKEQQSQETLTGPVVESQKHNFRVDTLTSELKNPWGIAVLPDGRILVTEREGVIRIIKDRQLLSESISVPDVYAHGQGGLMDIKLHPDYESNGWIYLTYAKQGEDGGGTVVARAKLEGTTLTNLEQLFQAEPINDSGVHFGSRVVFDGKGYIFFSSGERGTKENAQDLGNHLGKMLRLHEDGRVPSDNPFVDQAGAKPEIWSYGHRNPQGVVYDKATETLWDIEHGPRGGDELNRVEKGKNYGWPVITYGINYDGTPITDLKEKEGMEQPVRYWVPSIAPCGLTKVDSDKFPNWKDNLLAGALAHTHVTRIELNDGKYVGEEKLLDKIGRVRAVEQGPDGYIYVATEQPGMLVRLVPAE